MTARHIARRPSQRCRAILLCLSLAVLVVPAAANTQAPKPAPALQPIPDAGDWKLDADMPGTQHCSARINGETLDVMLVADNAGNMLLAAGRSDWSMPPQSVTFGLRIEDGAAIPMHGDTLSNLVLSTPTPDVRRRLEKADQLSWQLPTGTYKTRVTGLAKAFAAVKACNAEKASAPR